MYLMWGIPKGEYKPIIFNCTGVPDDAFEDSKELLAVIGKHEVGIRQISERYYMEEKDLNVVLNHYGIIDVPRIIGSRRCEVTYYADAEV